MNINNKYIVSNPKIRSGQPVIAGTRIPVYQLLEAAFDNVSMKSLAIDCDIPIEKMHNICESIIDLFTENSHLNSVDPGVLNMISG